MAKLNLTKLEQHFVDAFMRGTGPDNPAYLDMIDAHVTRLLTTTSDVGLKKVLEGVQWKIQSVKADEWLHELLTDPVKVKKKSETKTESFEKLGNVTKKHNTVLEVLRDHPGISRRRLAEILKWEINQVTPRVLELINLGLIVEQGTIYDEVTKRNAAALVAKEKESE